MVESEIVKETAEKNFSDALKDLLRQRKITYRKLESISNVSKTYLSRILVHNLIPSKEIIKKLSLGLGVNPEYFKEYRLLKIIDEIMIFSSSIANEDFEILGSLLARLKAKTKKEEVMLFSYAKGDYERRFDPDYLLNIKDLLDYQKKLIKYNLEVFRKLNNQEAEEAYANSD